MFNHRSAMALIRFIYVLLLLCLPLAPAMASPSFDCAKAKTPIENQVCASPALSALDLLMAKAYQTALSTLNADQTKITHDQRQWLRDTKALCQPGREDFAGCLNEAYNRRIVFLRNLTQKISTQNVCRPVANALTEYKNRNNPGIFDIISDISSSIYRNKDHTIINNEKEFEDKFRPDDNMKQIYSDKFMDSPDIIVQKFGKSNLWLASSSAGTADVEAFLFFSSDGKTSSVIDQPSLVKDADPTEYSVGTRGDAISINGIPAFIKQVDLGPEKEEIKFSIEAFDQDHWDVPCGIDVVFSTEIKASPPDCSAFIDCSGLSQLAAEITRQRNLDPKNDDFTPSVGVPENIPEAVSAWLNDGENPTWPDYKNYNCQGNQEPANFLLELRGNIYIACLGHTTIGWRTFPGYTMIIYTLSKDSKLQPVGAVNIDKKSGNVLRATVD